MMDSSRPVPHILVPGRGRPFLFGDSLDHSAPLVFTVPDVLSADECQATIARIEELGPEAAPITTSRGYVMAPEIRNNHRVVFDDLELAALLFARLRAAIPPTLCEMRAVGANERFRCYRYEPGQRFAPHYDGAFRRSADEESQLTLMVYLNEGFAGGDTAFHDFGVSVRPRTGMALLFQHRLLHEGCVLERGVKYALRSDVMYARERATA
jgi:predicted 2-oxoglutarate/Fe(II)-dependent dioxygenase YbiX